MKRYKAYDRLNMYMYSQGIYINGFNHREMIPYFYVMDDFGNLIEID